jgi:hypothetical protein
MQERERQVHRGQGLAPHLLHRIAEVALADEPVGSHGIRDQLDLDEKVLGCAGGHASQSTEHGSQPAFFFTERVEISSKATTQPFPFSLLSPKQNFSRLFHVSSSCDHSPRASSGSGSEKGGASHRVGDGHCNDTQPAPRAVGPRPLLRKLCHPLRESPWPPSNHRTLFPPCLVSFLFLLTRPSETDTVWQLLAYKIYRHAELEDDRLNPVDYARVSSQSRRRLVPCALFPSTSSLIFLPPPISLNLGLMSKVNLLPLATSHRWALTVCPCTIDSKIGH